MTGIDLVVLGIDGADPEFLEEAFERHEMENWRRLMGESFYTELPSTVPAITLPAWPCMFSGYKPGKFEAYHLAMSDFEDWDAEIVDSSYFEGYPFYDRIGKKVGLHSVPGTFPTYPVNGWMRSSSINRGFRFYPDELEDELGDIELEKQNSHGKITSRGKIETERENHEREREVAEHIFTKNPDVFVGVFQLVDRAGHFAEKKESLLENYQYVDDLIGEYMEKTEEKGANLLVVSDHGFQFADSKFNLVTFLEKEDLLEMSDEGGERLAYRLAKPLLDTRLKKYLKYLHDFYTSHGGSPMLEAGNGPLGAVSKESKVVPYFSEGREAGLKVHTRDMPHGLVPEEEKEEIIEETIEKLKSLERNGEKVIQEIWKGEELYPGAGQRPDIVLKTRKGSIVSTEPSSSVFDKTRSFTHDETGVLFAKGPDIDEEADDEVEIYDVAPLIYALLDEPIPDDLDGELPGEVVPDIEISMKNYSSEITDLDV